MRNRGNKCNTCREEGLGLYDLGFAKRGEDGVAGWSAAFYGGSLEARHVWDSYGPSDAWKLKLGDCRLKVTKWRSESGRCWTLKTDFVTRRIYLGYAHTGLPKLRGSLDHNTKALMQFIHFGCSAIYAIQEEPPLTGMSGLRNHPLTRLN